MRNGCVENQRLKLTVAPYAYCILDPYGFTWKRSVDHQPQMLPMIWLSAVREHVCSEHVSPQPSVRVDRSRDPFENHYDYGEAWAWRWCLK